MTLAQLRALVTPVLLRAALDDQIYLSLTGEAHGEDGYFMQRPPTSDSQQAAQTACQSAARWAFITLTKADATARPYSDDEQEVLSEALVQRAIYELGRQSEFDANFYKNKEDATALLNALLGLTGAGENKSIITSARSTKDAKQRSYFILPSHPFTRRR